MRAEVQRDLDQMRDAAGRLLAFTPTREPLPIDPLSHAAQEIHVASGDLLDLVRDGDRAVCLRLRPILHGLLERLLAVDELLTQHINTED